MLPLLQFLSKYLSLYIFKQGEVVSAGESEYEIHVEVMGIFVEERGGRTQLTRKLFSEFISILIFWSCDLCAFVQEYLNKTLYLTGAPALVSIFLRSAQIKIFLVWFKSIEVRFVQTRPFPISCIARAETVRKTNKLVVMVDYDMQTDVHVRSTYYLLLYAY